MEGMNEVYNFEEIGATITQRCRCCGKALVLKRIEKFEDGRSKWHVKCSSCETPLVLSRDCNGMIKSCRFDWEALK